MHEIHLVKKLLAHLKEEEERSHRKAKTVYVRISEFSSIKGAHLKDSFSRECVRTPFEKVSLSIETVPYGTEMDIVNIDFQD